MKIFPASLTEMYIEWELQGDTFTIYRSTSPTSGFEMLAEFIVQPFFIDKSVNLFDENISYYYRVEGFSGGVKIAEAGPDTLEYSQRDPIANKVIHESNVLLKQMRNPPVYFLLKRRAGMPCPNCYNPVTKRIKFPNCKVCGGTGILSGYHDPIATRISQDVSQMIIASDAYDSDKTVLTPIRAWIGNFPRLHPEDVMVDIMNQRYKIIGVTPRTKSQYLIRQVLDMAPLEKGHSAYNINVDRGQVPFV